ncbi:MAG: pantoate--beta-alanine ligase [Saprospiraceae bacterium]
MILFKRVQDLKKFVAARKKEGKSIGFSPTMGALHEGHLSLLQNSQQKCDVSIVSIFVNPTQFNDPEDLKKYPRNEEKDIALLAAAGCDLVFLPNPEEVYPKDLNTKIQIDLEGLDKVMEGAFRPGHFDGVVQVVKRLLDIVEPDYLFMGQKDFQQFTIIQLMLEKTSLPVKLEVVPIVREASGLAKSSRNVRLSEDAKGKATAIFRNLSGLASALDQLPLEVVKSEFSKSIMEAGLEPEYLSVIDGKTLQDVNDYKNHDYVVACVAAWIEGVRLIDNMILKQ